MGSTHLFALKKKHENIDRKIYEEQGRPASNDLQLRRLKEERLHLKEQIYRIEESTA